MAKEKVLFIFSDMRQQTRELDLESPSMVPSFDRIEEKRTELGISSLSDIHIWVLGVDGAGKSLLYWQSPREFWIEYFHTCGATLESYTVLRDSARTMAPLDTSQ
ncbi:MAG: hypothetical protein WAN65_27250 [Candidatus Sulfotelmatobacter sp.]